MEQEETKKLKANEESYIKKEVDEKIVIDEEIVEIFYRLLLEEETVLGFIKLAKD
jgi:hypothetical protein